MKLDNFKQAKNLRVSIEEKKDLLENVKKLLPDEDMVEVKVRGTKFSLPKALFIAQHKKIIQNMEDEIIKLEDDFNKI